MKLAKKPLSWRRLLRLLHILTAHMERMMATMKNRMPPTTPAVMALALSKEAVKHKKILIMFLKTLASLGLQLTLAYLYIFYHF